MTKGEMRPNVQLVAYPVAGVKRHGYVSIVFPLTVISNSPVREVYWARDAHATLLAV